MLAQGDNNNSDDSNRMNLVLFNFHDLVLVMTIVLCFVLALALVVRLQPNYWAGVFAVGFFAVEAAIPFDTLVSFGAKFHEYAIAHFPNWFYVFEMGYWLDGPFLLWLVRAKLRKSYRLSWRDAIFVLPFLLFFFHQYLAYDSLPTLGKVYLEQRHNILDESVSIFYIVFIRSALRAYFAFLAISELRRHAAVVMQCPWLNYFVYSFASLWGWACLVSLGLILNNHFKQNWDVSSMGLFGNYALCISLGAMLVVLSSAKTSQAEPPVLVDDDKLPSSADLNQQDVQSLEDYMLQQKPFLQADLTCEAVASSLGWQPRYLTSLVARAYDVSFFEFINRYRIDEAKARMQHEDYRYTTILDIMFEVGFNSKSTFNTAFKKSTGLTPREFKKQQSEKSHS